jgi:hypothetical protein
MGTHQEQGEIIFFKKSLACLSQKKNKLGPLMSACWGFSLAAWSFDFTLWRNFFVFKKFPTRRIPLLGEHLRLHWVSLCEHWWLYHVLWYLDIDIYIPEMLVILFVRTGNWEPNEIYIWISTRVKFYLGKGSMIKLI